jgi:branched-chain amino acid transport system permease protein
MAVGAYVAALLTIPAIQKQLFYKDLPPILDFLHHTELAPPTAALIAGGCGLVVALVVGVPVLRLTGLPAAFATLCVLVIANVVLANWSQVTRGNTTTLGVPQYATVMNTLVVAIGAILIAFLFQRSRVGFLLRASREDEYAAAALGIRVVWGRWLAFGLSGLVVAVGGAMYAYYLPFASQEFYLDRTILIVAMLIIGGQRSLWGAVSGALLVGLLWEFLRRLESGADVAGLHLTTPAGTTAVALGLVLLLILLLRPRGITGGKEITAASLGSVARRIQGVALRLARPGRSQPGITKEER